MSRSRDGAQRARRVLVVGSGRHFLSGISYYTYYLCQALNERHHVSALLMRRLIPARWYPGKARIGGGITPADVAELVPTFDGVDWWGIPSMPRALRFIRRERPDVIVLEWWSASVLPWYLLVARAASREGADLVVELHELQDSGEARLPIVGSLGRLGLRALCRHATRFVVHSEWDRGRVTAALGVDPATVRVIPHGPYYHAGTATSSRSEEPQARISVATAADSRTQDLRVRILFFGTIRPYKGLEDLVDAFERLPREDGRHWQLAIVGETWERWTLPLEKVKRSRFLSDIEVVNRYVTDAEATAQFAQADVVALPYLRSSASGPLAVAKAHGLPVVVTDVGGLAEAAAGYSGAISVRPGDPVDLARGLVEALGLRGVVHCDPATWDTVAAKYDDLFASL